MQDHELCVTKVQPGGTVVQVLYMDRCLKEFWRATGLTLEMQKDKSSRMGKSRCLLCAWSESQSICVPSECAGVQ